MTPPPTRPHRGCQKTKDDRCRCQNCENLRCKNPRGKNPLLHSSIYAAEAARNEAARIAPMPDPSGNLLQQSSNSHMYTVRNDESSARIIPSSCQIAFAAANTPQSGQIPAATVPMSSGQIQSTNAQMPGQIPVEDAQIPLSHYIAANAQIMLSRILVANAQTFLGHNPPTNALMLGGASNSRQAEGLVPASIAPVFGQCGSVNAQMSFGQIPAANAQTMFSQSLAANAQIMLSRILVRNAHMSFGQIPYSNGQMPSQIPVVARQMHEEGPVEHLNASIAPTSSSSSSNIVLSHQTPPVNYPLRADGETSGCNYPVEDVPSSKGFDDANEH